MTAMNAGAAAPTPAFVSPSGRLEAFCRSRTFDAPTLVLDVDRVEAQYRALKAGLGHADIHYALKANPHPAILRRLVGLGARFDAAQSATLSYAMRTSMYVDAKSMLQHARSGRGGRGGVNGPWARAGRCGRTTRSRARGGRGRASSRP